MVAYHYAPSFGDGSGVPMVDESLTSAFAMVAQATCRLARIAGLPPDADDARSEE
ncbi:hypothetical protein [Kitasatospora sp. NPDC054795]